VPPSKNSEQGHTSGLPLAYHPTLAAARPKLSIDPSSWIPLNTPAEWSVTFHGYVLPLCKRDSWKIADSIRDRSAEQWSHFSRLKKQKFMKAFSVKLGILIFCFTILFPVQYCTVTNSLIFKKKFHFETYWNSNFMSRENVMKIKYTSLLRFTIKRNSSNQKYIFVEDFIPFLVCLRMQSTAIK